METWLAGVGAAVAALYIIRLLFTSKKELTDKVVVITGASSGIGEGKQFQCWTLFLQIVLNSIKHLIAVALSRLVQLKLVPCAISHGTVQKGSIIINYAASTVYFF